MPVTILLVIFILSLCYLKLFKPLQHWHNKGISYVRPWPVLGVMATSFFQKKHMADIFADAYRKFQDKRYFGIHIFSSPMLLIRDYDLIKRICVHDFDKFSDHTPFLPETADPFASKNLFSRKGQDWHNMRTVVSPAFTSSKMKAMFPLIAKVSRNTVDYYHKQGDLVVADMKDTFKRYGIDVIASCAFGFECDSLTDRDNQFYLESNRAFKFSGIQILKFLGATMSPALMNLLKVNFFDEHSRNFFTGIVKQTIDHREKTGASRPDLIHLLREAQKSRLVNDEDDELINNHSSYTKGKNFKKPIITDEDITIQAMSFFFAGYDTVASSLSTVIYNLATNPDVQEKLIKEVDETLIECNGEITYDALFEMKYLDNVISETMRLWSVFMNRRVVQPVTIEPVNPGEKPLHLEAGTDCMIPVFAIHRDPKYYPNPDKFIPERFSDENKKNLVGVPYFPFGLGPRICIGTRFALMEMKIMIVSFLTKFTIVPVDKTEVPLIIAPDSLFYDSKNGYWLGLQPRNNN